MDVLIAGRLWAIKCALVALLGTFVFTCAPAVLVVPGPELSPAYELKARQPFADTARLTISDLPGESSHGAKLTPRLVGSLFLFATSKLSLHPYIPATIGGLIFLLAGVTAGFRLSGDRATGLYIGLTFAGLYAASACFAVNFTPKPFDGIVLGMIGFALIVIELPVLLALASFLACWTDERAIVSLVFIAVLMAYLPNMEQRQKKRQCLIIAGAVVAYVLTRFALASALKWTAPDTTMIGSAVMKALPVWQLIAWLCFEGAWVAVAAAAWSLARDKSYTDLAVLLGSIALAFISCLVVLDMSRATIFAFPVVLVAFALLVKQSMPVIQIRAFAAAGALVSLLAPNFEVITGITIKWLPSLPAALLLSAAH